MADGSFAIRNAASEVFSDPTLLMCRFHFHKNLDGKFYGKDCFLMINFNFETDIDNYPYIDTNEKELELRNIIKNDIYILQNLPKQSFFQSYFNIFKRFWEKHAEKFYKYFVSKYYEEKA